MYKISGIKSGVRLTYNVNECMVWDCIKVCPPFTHGYPWESVCELSHTDNCMVFHPLPVYHEKNLQRRHNACAGFVTRKFTALEGVIKLNWLPLKKTLNSTFSNLEVAHKPLYNKNNFPEYLKLSLHQVIAYNLRSSRAPVFSIPKESGTFQHLAALRCSIHSL